MEELITFLRTIGLYKNEAEIYSTLLGIGPVTVLEIAKSTKMHRSNVYDTLRNLVSRGLVFEITEDIKKFGAHPAECLKDFLRYRQTELSEILKIIHEKQRKTDIKIKTSKGKFALCSMIDSLLSGDIIEVYGIPKEEEQIIGPMLKEFHKQRIKNKITMKLIYNSDCKRQMRELAKKKFTETRTLSPEYDSYATTIISGGRTILIIWGEEIIILEIEDKLVSSSYRHYFNILWEKADPLS